jgi:hypothetical protein
MKIFQASKKLYPYRHMDGKGNAVETFHDAFRLLQA